MRTFRRGVACFIAVALATACGSSRDSFDDGDSPGTFGKPDDGTPGGSFDTTDGGNAGTPQAIGSDQKECASSFSEGNVMPVSLVLMYDKSQSMLQPTGTGASKWDAAKQGVTSFVTDPGSAGLSAAIQFFSGPPLGQTGALCQAATYSSIAAGPVALPDNSVISGAIGQQSPSGTTATYYAYQGARAIANTLLATNSQQRVAIVFVTDGIPEGCSFDNSIDSTAVLAQQAFAAGVATFVIGVGSSLTTLNAIAKAGGTSAAHIVDTNGNVATDLLAALVDIRGHVASCSLQIPAAPEGKKLDYNAVNVGYGGNTLTYDKDCAGPGWHYDDVTTPHTIELCPSTCDDVKKTANAKVTFALGCATKGGVH